MKIDDGNDNNDDEKGEGQWRKLVLSSPRIHFFIAFH